MSYPPLGEPTCQWSFDGPIGTPGPREERLPTASNTFLSETSRQEEQELDVAVQDLGGGIASLELIERVLNRAMDRGSRSLLYSLQSSVL